MRHNLSKEKKHLQRFIPELGIDPLKPTEIRFILGRGEDPEDEREKTDDKDEKKKKAVLSGSELL